MLPGKFADIQGGATLRVLDDTLFRRETRVDELRFSICRQCHEAFLVCFRCGWAARYCGQGCAQVARAESMRRARRKHRQSPEGRADHRDAERRRRHRWRVGDHHSEKLTDVSLLPATDAAHGDELPVHPPGDPQSNSSGVPQNSAPEQAVLVVDEPVALLTATRWKGREVVCSRCGRRYQAARAWLRRCDRAGSTGPPR
jgi:hypothetical protein